VVKSRKPHANAISVTVHALTRIVGRGFEFESVHRLSEVIPDLPLHASQRRNENFGSRRTSLHDAGNKTCDRREEIRKFHARPVVSLSHGPR
jgi:hypothetical protein